MNKENWSILDEFLSNLGTQEDFCDPHFLNLIMDKYCPNQIGLKSSDTCTYSKHHDEDTCPNCWREEYKE